MYIEKELESQVVVMEGKSAILSCEISCAKVPVTWKKNDALVEEGGRCVIKKTGVTHTLEIHKLCREDAGEYCCITRGKRTTARLIVRGRWTLNNYNNNNNMPFGGVYPVSSNMSYNECAYISSH